MAMRRRANPRGTACVRLTWASLLLFAAVCLPPTAIAKHHDDEIGPLTVRVEAPLADVTPAVKQVTQDQIIHGTYSYEKERILYGAHSAGEARVFGRWKGEGTAYYKVAQGVLSPRYYKDSQDIGTISVRYIVQEAGPNATILQIQSVFVDARTVHHPSLGNVESSEYAAIQEHLRKIQEARLQAEQGMLAASAPSAAPTPPSPSPLLNSRATTPAIARQETVPELQKKVEALRHQVELRVKDPGAQLKSAPFHSAATLESLPTQTEVLVVIVSPYWYGVETDDGHRGWIHHSQLEPLP